jgi:type II secretory pathway component PulC
MTLFCTLLVASSMTAVPLLDSARLEKVLGFSGRGRPPNSSSATVPSPLPIKLWGTLRASVDDASLALVEVDAKFRTVSVGDMVADAELVQVEQRGLVLKRHGRLERVSSVVGAASPSASSVDRTPPLWNGALPPDAPAVSRATLRQSLANAHAVARQVRLVPMFNGGKVTGARASSGLSRILWSSHWV